MAKIYEFLANGFEEVEALAPIDTFRRAGAEVQTVSVTGSEWVESSHGVTIKTDMKFEDMHNFDDTNMLMLPGGIPGATNLSEHADVKEVLLDHSAKGKHIDAICAAPMVLGSLGLLKGRKATCSPGFEKYLEGTEYTAELFIVDGNIIMGEGPAATFPYAYEILKMFMGEAKTKGLQQKMQYARSMER